MNRALTDVARERNRQDDLWGVQDHAPGMFLAILTEEVGEVAKEVADGRVQPFDADAYREELVQVAAVAVAAIEAHDRGQA